MVSRCPEGEPFATFSKNEGFVSELCRAGRRGCRHAVGLPPGCRPGGCMGACGTDFRVLRALELVINSATTIITFLMVFIIQNTQNRDFRMLQVQVDELV